MTAEPDALRLVPDISEMHALLEANRALPENVRPIRVGYEYAAYRLMKAAAPAVQPAAGREEIGWAVGFMNKAAVMLGRGEMPAPGSQYAADWWRAHGVLLAALSQPGPASEGDGE